MRLTFLGCKRPYRSEKTGKTYYNAYFSTPDAQDETCFQFMECDVLPSVHAKLLGVDIGQRIDVDAMPRMFAGKVQGLEITGING